MQQNLQTAYFAAGCFWGIEAYFGAIPGVVSTTVGYMGGHTTHPTYREVCTGRSGHAETVAVKFDPAIVSFETLLTAFWHCHDPTSLNRQGPDVGSQYRSAIFCSSPEQLSKALASKESAEGARPDGRPIVTVISSAPPFYSAEEYHQDYYAKHGGSCAVSFDAQTMSGSDKA